MKGCLKFEGGGRFQSQLGPTALTSHYFCSGRRITPSQAIALLLLMPSHLSGSGLCIYPARASALTSLRPSHFRFYRISNSSRVVSSRKQIYTEDSHKRIIRGPTDQRILRGRLLNQAVILAINILSSRLSLERSIPPL